MQNLLFSWSISSSRLYGVCTRYRKINPLSLTAADLAHTGQVGGDAFWSAVIHSKKTTVSEVDTQHTEAAHESKEEA